MHERSLVKTLLKQVDAVRQQHEAEHVTEVRVEVGPLSGVEPLLLATAFAQLATDSTLAGAKLVIDEVALLAECKPCGREFEVHDFVFRCPICRGNVHVTRGDEFQLVSVSLELFQPTQELAS
jgi:hydrogenase nickel incorporation protein HypA/HybF